jgi:hypothetical protein
MSSPIFGVNRARAWIDWTAAGWIVTRTKLPAAVQRHGRRTANLAAASCNCSIEFAVENRTNLADSAVPKSRPGEIATWALFMASNAKSQLFETFQASNHDEQSAHA